MSRLLLLLPLLLLAGPAAAAPEGGPAAAACDDQHGACRSGCALDWGASVRTRDRLGRCLAQCERVSTQCLDRALGRARGEKVKPVEQPRNVQPRKAPSRYAEREPRKRSGGGSSPSSAPPPPMNVGAPDWLDEEPAKPPRRSAPAQAQASDPAAPAAPPAEERPWVAPTAPTQAAAASSGLPRAEAETLAPFPAASSGSDSFEPDPLLPEGFEQVPSRNAAVETLPPLEPLPPLDPLPAPTREAPAAKADGSTLWPAKAERAPTRKAAPSAAPAPREKSTFKKDDISEWDPD